MNQLSLPNNPHAVIEILRPDKTDGEATIVWDSWDLPRLFQSVDVELVTNESSQAQWTFFDPRFRVIDSFAKPEGISQMVVKVYLGYGQELGEPVFKGLLAQIERGDSSTSFTAFDMGFRMKLVKKAGYKNRKDDLGIIRDLATRNKLKFEGPENPLKLEPHRAMMQDEQTDWEHALERARDAGLVLFVRQDTLFAKYPATIEKPILKFENRKDFTLLSDWDFIYRTPENQDGRPRLVTVRRRGKGGKRLESQSNTSTGERERLILKRDLSRPTKSKLSRRAQAQKDLDREHAFEGHLEAVFPLNGERLDARKTINIEGIGKLFSGDYICDTVDYQFAPGKLSMLLDLYRDIKN